MTRESHAFWLALYHTKGHYNKSNTLCEFCVANWICIKKMSLYAQSSYNDETLYLCFNILFGSECDTSQQKVPYVYFERYVSSERQLNNLSNDTKFIKIGLRHMKI